MCTYCSMLKSGEEKRERKRYVVGLAGVENELANWLVSGVVIVGGIGLIAGLAAVAVSLAYRR